MIEEFNLLVCGVGGQGVLTLSRIIALSALKSNFKVRVGETLGMSQRGGIVNSFVRFGKNVLSPLFEKGMADAVIALDYVEAARSLQYASKRTVFLVDSNTIPPLSTILGLESLPDLDHVKRFFKENAVKAYFFNAFSIASSLSLPTSNTVMLGVFGRLFQKIFDRNVLISALREIVPAKYVEKNIEAFQFGWRLMDDNAAF
ncbi:MAG: indolepyruvate oxidoreductase subunit beta [archaeon GB-1867-097]|nr:indolepyruvate oxidoreductase subunit beta [Candidatus Culexmicrobium thermophilum]MCS7384775.1 indolepyruvate oxidoreductase subunit beta [Candidatus Culexmicrobium thermophilum]